MNNTKKLPESQDYHEPQAENLGITQSSGSDRLSGYRDNCSLAFKVKRINNRYDPSIYITPYYRLV